MTVKHYGIVSEIDSYFRKREEPQIVVGFSADKAAEYADALALVSNADEHGLEIGKDITLDEIVAAKAALDRLWSDLNFHRL